MMHSATNTNQLYIEMLPDDNSLKLMKIEGSSFLMGSNEDKWEEPIHKVTMPDFYLGVYSITNTQYSFFLNNYGSDKLLKGENKGQLMIYEESFGILKKENIWHPLKGFEHHPVVNITWYGAVVYCDWLSQQTGKSYRLPSESEWEYAARGGKKSMGFKYSGSNKLKEVGWYNLNSHGETKPVGLKLPNELGLYDMSGNVWEWCGDHWHANYKDAPDDGSVWVGDGDRSLRVVRGGSWDDFDLSCRVSIRYWFVADNRDLYIGFRVARY